MSDLAQTFRRSGLPKRISGNTVMLIIAPVAYGIVSWLILQSAGNPPATSASCAVFRSLKSLTNATIRVESRAA